MNTPIFNNQMRAIRRPGADARVDLTQRRAWQTAIAITSLVWSGPKQMVQLHGTVTKYLVVVHDGTGYVLADFTSATLNGGVASPYPMGIALGTGVSGDWITIGYAEGLATINAVAAAGVPYFLGAAGTIVPAADVGSGKYLTYLGGGKSTTLIAMKFHALGVAVA